jgi:hypothetical protein
MTSASRQSGGEPAAVPDAIGRTGLSSSARKTKTAASRATSTSRIAFQSEKSGATAYAAASAAHTALNPTAAISQAERLAPRRLTTS